MNHRSSSSLQSRLRSVIVTSLCASAFAFALPSSVSARNVEYTLPIDEVLRMPEAQRDLDGSVRFYLQGQDHSAIVYRHSEEVARGNIRGAGEQEVESCKRAALKVLVHYQETARKMGANAVVDIVSHFNKRPFISRSQYECHAGSRSVVVVLRGAYAKIAY